jgi:hypothetical protein
MDEYELQRLEHDDVTDWVATLYAQSGRTAQKQWERFASDSATVCHRIIHWSGHYLFFIMVLVDVVYVHIRSAFFFGWRFARIDARVESSCSIYCAVWHVHQFCFWICFSQRQAYREAVFTTLYNVHPRAREIVSSDAGTQDRLLYGVLDCLYAQTAAHRLVHMFVVTDCPLRLPNCFSVFRFAGVCSWEHASVVQGQPHQRRSRLQSSSPKVYYLAEAGKFRSGISGGMNWNAWNSCFILLDSAS